MIRLTTTPDGDVYEVVPNKRGPGRPPLPSARSTRIVVRVTTPEAVEIARRAEAAGLSVSDYVRGLALR